MMSNSKILWNHVEGSGDNPHGDAAITDDFGCLTIISKDSMGRDTVILGWDNSVEMAKAILEEEERRATTDISEGTELITLKALNDALKDRGIKSSMKPPWRWMKSPSTSGRSIVSPEGERSPS